LSVRRRTLEGSMPTWSPDGKQIAYISGDDIFRANADGSGVARVARGGSAWQLAFRSGIDWRVR
jgi:Tol biopolymer transport system component